MKKLILAIVPVIITAALTSCSKTETPEVPNPVDTTTKPTSAAPTPFTPTVADVNGSMAAVQMSYKMEQMGISVDVDYETAVATFYNGSTMVDAGTVSVNSINLEKQTNNSYLKMATTGLTVADLKYSSGVDWSVSGGVNGVPAISYKHGTNFPSYTGNVPDALTKANGLSFSFTSSNTKNADSVYVFIAAPNGKTFLRGYAPNAGSVTISASDLSGLPTVSDKTAYLEVLPVKFAVETFSGKRFVFIKEQAIVRNININ